MLDAVILVAAAALGVLLVGRYSGSLREDLRLMAIVFEHPHHIFFSSTLIITLILDCVAFLVPWTLALLALRLLPPRPPTRELFRSPGMVACYTAALSSFALLLLAEALCFYGHAQERTGPSLFVLFVLPVVGLPVAVNLTVLAMRGGWRSDHTWIDQWGLVTGFVWMSILPLRLWLFLI